MRRLVFPSMLLLELAAVAAARPCLSVSPFRASRASDSAAVMGTRERLVDSLAGRLVGWDVRPAGGCPDSATVLDLFQRPGDMVDLGEGGLLRARLEWRHAQGMVLVSLEPQGRLQGDVGMWASTLEATIRTQMLVPVQVSADVPGALASGGISGSLPVSGLLPPGRFRVRLEAAGYVPQVLDTVLRPGDPVQLDARLLPLPVTPPPVRASRGRSVQRWAWAGGAVLLGGAGWFAWRQVQAQDRYSSLGGDAPASSFERRWSELRNANLWRNGLGGGAVGAFCLAAVLRFGEASFSW